MSPRWWYEVSRGPGHRRGFVFCIGKPLSRGCARRVVHCCTPRCDEREGSGADVVQRTGFRCGGAAVPSPPMGRVSGECRSRWSRSGYSPRRERRGHGCAPLSCAPYGGVASRSKRDCAVSDGPVGGALGRDVSGTRVPQPLCWIDKGPGSATSRGRGIGNIPSGG